MRTKDLIAALDGLLEPSKFRDYCPNGLQIQGKKNVTKIVCGVSASEALIDEAIRRKADAVIVHHGYFWKNENPRISGIKRTRIKKILDHDLNLIAYHLPLDANEKVGNNYEMAKALKLQDVAPLEGNPLVLSGIFNPPVTIEELSNKIDQIIGRVPYIVGGDSDLKLRKVAF